VHRDSQELLKGFITDIESRLFEKNLVKINQKEILSISFKETKSWFLGLFRLLLELFRLLLEDPKILKKLSEHKFRKRSNLKNHADSSSEFLVTWLEYFYKYKYYRFGSECLDEACILLEQLQLRMEVSESSG
jgi:hypothetical protein